MVKESNRAVYLPGLNGLRAIAAIGVVIFHTTKHIDVGDFGLGAITILGHHIRGYQLGPYGVTIFFALSGFLITYLILKEKETVGHFNIKNFYIRRILRIWPLYYLFFIVCIAIILYFGIPLGKKSAILYVFFAANIPFILHKPLPILAHYWSLGMEEQFYLFFPQIAKLSNKRLLRITVGIIFTILILKLIYWILILNDIILSSRVSLISRFDIMLIGVVGAILYYQNKKWFFSIATHKITQIISWLCILLLATNCFIISPHIFNHEIIAVVTVFLIMGQITKKNNLINLENKICDFIGRISYGIYVIHPLFIFYYSKLIQFQTNSIYNYLIIYLLVISSTIFTAYLSYELFEKRFLKLKTRFSTIKSKNTKRSL